MRRLRYLPSIKATNGFTMLELLVTLAILSIVITLALPPLNNFIVNMRVDNEISQLHRLILTARNSAINTGQVVTLCPLDTTNNCNKNWNGKLSAFIDLNNNGIYESSNNETLIRIKEAVNTNDSLTYPNEQLSYEATGQATRLLTGTFIYCPGEDDDKGRAIEVSAVGRIYASTDIDNDAKDETRDGNEITCN